MKNLKVKISILSVSWMLAALMVAGCGSGGSSALGPAPAAPAATGTVAVYLADAPSDEYDSVVLYIKKVMLIPPESQPDRKIATVFESKDPEGYPVDLLKYRFQDFLLSVKDHVEAGYYEKIRLVVTKAEASGGPCRDNIKIPSGKIDLIPREAVHVQSGTTLALRLDVDVDKSFDLHVAGNSGMCIFRPVVFVEETSLPRFSKCTKLVKGTVQELLYENDVLSGFILLLDRSRGTVEVIVPSDTEIFDEDGMPVPLSALSVDQFVHLKGSVLEDGRIEALMIVMGNVLDISGTAMSGVDEEGLFDLNLDPGQALVDDTILVDADQALIIEGCDNITDTTAIVPWAKTDAIGKVDLNNGIFIAIAVMVDSPRIEGQLVSITESGQGYDLGIIPDGSVDSELVYLPDAGLLYLGRDGNIPVDQLQTLLDCGKDLFVIAKLTSNPDYLEAERVTVKPERVTGVVEYLEAEDVVVIEDDQGSQVSLQLQTGVQVILHGRHGDENVAVDMIEAGDRVTAFGLFACDDALYDFMAYVVILKPDNLPVFHLPEIINDNDEMYMLPAGSYDQSLTVNGNSFTLIGNETGSCEGPGLTIIEGDVVINGNNARFENIKFNGSVIENGNAAEFINCCF